MTIDEAIAHAREVAETCEYEASKYDMSDFYESHVACQEGKCGEEHRQLAEWLEELKAYKEIGTIEGYKSAIECYTEEYLLRKSNKQYNKAIDDFVENISLKISESIIWGMLVNSHKDNSFNDTSDKIVDYVINTANKIAKQLKEGGENEQSV